MQQDTSSIEPRPMTENEVRQWTMMMHMGLLVGFLVPIVGALAPAVMWFLRRRGSERVAQHGVMLVNAAISYHGYMAVAFLLSLYVFGMLPFIVLVASIVTFPVIGAVKANDGILWRYPLVRDIMRMPRTGDDHAAGPAPAPAPAEDADADADDAAGPAQATEQRAA